MSEQVKIQFYYEVSEDLFLSIEQITNISDIMIDNYFDTNQSKQLYKVLFEIPTARGSESVMTYEVKTQIADEHSARLILRSFVENLNDIRQNIYSQTNSNVKRIV